MRFEEGKYYHIYNRSINKELLFKTTENYHFFLKRYSEYATDFIDTFAYCLMPTHFHILVRIRKLNKVNSRGASTGTLSDVEKALKNLFISYSKAVNKSFNRQGNLFQSKYKHKEVSDSAYFSQIIAYIHYNPVKAGLSDSLDTWVFSSYKALVNNKSTLLKRREVLEWFGGRHQFETFHQCFRPSVITNNVFDNE